MENTDFGQIYAEYRSYSMRIANTILGNEDEAEDVCQDVFEIIYNMGPRVDISNRKKLKSLITTITYHKAMDYCKTGYKKYECANSDMIEQITDIKELDTQKESVDEEILALETKLNVNCIFQKLRKKNSVNYYIFVYVKIYDIPPRLVADWFHISENNVNNRIMRTRRWLVREYNKLLQ
ncbi:MAG: sigma-70 family RNA polymerase sigma factor [Blautia sp.]|nr:sigma-70 family RNA polymerase sigma factor [Blautia sp.]